MKNDSKSKKISHYHFNFILVGPQMGENIGAVARGISNFGSCDLAIVNPRDGWPNEKAFAMAAHGEFILHNAKIFNNLSDSLADSHFVVATTSNQRHVTKPCYELADFCSRIDHIVQGDDQSDLGKDLKKISVVLGRESTGLRTEELNLAHCLLTIATQSNNPSLNLGMAATIIAYELSKNCIISGDKIIISQPELILRKGNDLAEHEHIENFIQNMAAIVVEKRVDEKDDDIELRLQNMQRKMRDLLLKGKATKSDIGALYWLIKFISR